MNEVWSDRMVEIECEWRSGLTLQELGYKYGVTRERIRQVLRKFGIARNDGGIAVRGKARRAALDQRRNLRFLTKYGMSCAAWRSVPTKLKRAYVSQKRSARCRGVAFDILLSDWLSIWEASGKLARRGTGRDSYCMARRNDRGGYTVGNVYITTNEANCREYAKSKAVGLRTKRSPHGVGIYCAYPGGSRPWMAKCGKRVLGYFPTKKGAQGARSRFVAANPKAGRSAITTQVTPSGNASAVGPV